MDDEEFRALCERVEAALATPRPLGDEDLRAFMTHVLADLHDVTKMVTEMHAELGEFRPVLAMFKPGSKASAVDKAGVLRSMRKAAKGG